MGITCAQALGCFVSDDLIGLGMEADAVRQRLHSENVVSYTVQRALPIDGLEEQDIEAQTRQAGEDGCTGMLLQGGSLTLDGFEQLFTAIKQESPSLWIEALSATQVLKLASSSGIALGDTLARLRDSGLDSLPSYAVVLDDEIRRRVAPEKCSTQDWLRVHRTAHRLGLATTASLIFGCGESMEQRVAHLELLRQLQEETGGFTAFTPLAHQPDTASGGRALDGPTAVEYLKTLAVSRLMLEGIKNLQGSWETQGLKVLQMGLRFGSNDAGPIDLSDPGGATPEEELRRVIRDAGFKPVQRDGAYRTMFLN
jgi:cyclic dehypoxanthinyl futalosine synthase